MVVVVGMIPVKLPPEIKVIGAVVMKSSADSISILPALPGREAVPIRLLTVPVENVNTCARAELPRAAAQQRAARLHKTLRMVLPFFLFYIVGRAFLPMIHRFLAV